MKPLKLMSQRLLKFMFNITLVATFVFSSWIGSVYASTITGLYINGFGNIGNAYVNLSGYEHYAKTYTNQTIYYQAVNLRHWHGYLEHEKFSSTYNATTTSQVSYSTSTYGPNVSQHTFYGAPGTGLNYYYYLTSGTASTYNIWACGQTNC